jgi:basic membrane lipoprotein Med (substrate-binding protein (PBP1-ABC) superfamily)
MSDQNSLAPETVITGPVWNMEPTVQYIINQVAGGTYTAQDLKDFSMMAKGGSSLAPLYSFEESLDADLVALVRQREGEIMSGLFRVPIDENMPIGE